MCSCRLTPDLHVSEYERSVHAECLLVNRDEEVVAVASLMFDPAVARVAELMASGQTITKAQAQ